MKKYLFPIDALVVWCPTWSKNLGRPLIYNTVSVTYAIIHYICHWCGTQILWPSETASKSLFLGSCLTLIQSFEVPFYFFFFVRKVNRNFLILLPIYKSDVTTDFKVYFYGLLITFFDFGHKNMIGRYLIGILMKFAQIEPYFLKK